MLVMSVWVGDEVDVCVCVSFFFVQLSVCVEAYVPCVFLAFFYYLLYCHIFCNEGEGEGKGG